MAIDTWLAFVVAASVILVIPGPTIIFVVGQSLVHGPRASLPLCAGVILGDTACIFLSLIGLGALLTFFSAAFVLVKFAGAAYLIYLGLEMMRKGRNAGLNQTADGDFRPRTLLRDVFLVNALNPKGIIFFSAFMPQFVTPDGPVLFQLMILGTTFLCLAFVNVMLYSLLAGRMTTMFKSRKRMRMFNLSGGLCMICAGVYAAAAKRG